MKTRTHRQAPNKPVTSSLIDSHLPLLSPNSTGHPSIEHSIRNGEWKEKKERKRALCSINGPLSTQNADSAAAKSSLIMCVWVAIFGCSRSAPFFRQSLPSFTPKAKAIALICPDFCPPFIRTFGHYYSKTTLHWNLICEPMLLINLIVKRCEHWKTLKASRTLKKKEFKYLKSPLSSWCVCVHWKQSLLPDLLRFCKANQVQPLLSSQSTWTQLEAQLHKIKENRMSRAYSPSRRLFIAGKMLQFFTSNRC